MSETPLRARIAEVMASTPDVPASSLRRARDGWFPPEDLSTEMEKARGAIRTRQVAKLRAQAVLDAAETVQDGAGYVPVALPTGQVLEFERVESAPGYPEGTAVRVRPRGAPHNGDGDVIVVNPPTLVPDPRGSIVVRGVRHREDPLAALGMALERVYGRGE